MNKLAASAFLALPLAVGGLVYATSQSQADEKPRQTQHSEGYICPATGEELPCPNCCPLKG